MERRENIVIGAWRDKRVKLVIFICYKFELTFVANRNGNEKVIPNIDGDYNQFISSTDRTDQMAS